MKPSSVLLTAAFGLWAVVAQGQGIPTAASSLSATDRAEIQQLVARYARALGGCAADEYASLFTEDGVFVTDDFRGATHRELYGQRGKIEGRAGLRQLVQTEDFCLNPAQKSATPAAGATTSRPVPTVVIEASPEGATGRASLGGGGHYEDVYVKTSEGWRFKRRTVFMPPASGSPAPATPSR